MLNSVFAYKTQKFDDISTKGVIRQQKGVIRPQKGVM